MQMRQARKGSEVSGTTLEIARKVHPRRYKRFKDLRSLEDASAWAKKLDWRGNPYDRFLLRREILRHLEELFVHEPGYRNVFRYASRQEIAAEVDLLMDKFPKKFEKWGVFNYVLMRMPFHMAFKHGLVRHSRLQEALGRFPSQKRNTKDSRTKESSQ